MEGSNASHLKVFIHEGLIEEETLASEVTVKQEEDIQGGYLYYCDEQTHVKQEDGSMISDDDDSELTHVNQEDALMITDYGDPGHIKQEDDETISDNNVEGLKKRWMGVEMGLCDTFQKEGGAWTHEQVLKLIGLIKERPSLYDPKHHNYKSRVVRNELLNECKNGLQSIRERTSIEEIKKKWSAIRQTYIGEKKKEENSIRSGTATDLVYRPSLFYYNEMAFLQDSLSALASQSTHKEDVGSLEVSSSVGSGIGVREEAGCSSTEPPPLVFANNSLMTKRRRMDPSVSLSQVTEALLSVSSSLQAFSSTVKVEDNEDRYAKTIADRLRTFSKSDRVVITKQIDEILSQKCLEKKSV